MQMHGHMSTLVNSSHAIQIRLYVRLVNDFYLQMFTFIVGTVCISPPFCALCTYIDYIDSTEEEPAL